MALPNVRFELPDGALVDAGPDALVGRASHATVRVHDARVSTVHAELRWGAGGFVLLARGGRLVVEGRGAREVPLYPGLVITLAPGVCLVVRSVQGGDRPPDPPTVGRERLRFVVSANTVHVYVDAEDEPLVVLVGSAATIVSVLLEKRGVGLPWDEVAEAAWPEDAVLRRALREWTDVDERRFRNRWDQRLVTLRRQVEPLRGGELIVFRLGIVAIRLSADDIVA